MKCLLVCLAILSVLLMAGCSGNSVESVVTSASSAASQPAAIEKTTMSPSTPDQTTMTSGSAPTTSVKPIGTRPTQPRSETRTISVTSTSAATTVKTTQSVNTQYQPGILNLGLMVHLEGWADMEETVFRRHASLLREYAALFEKYGAKLTLESKEMTEGAIRWNDNVFLELQNRGHAIGVHADVGGNKTDTLAGMKTELAEMKSRLESLHVKVRHVSGICSKLDWVTAAADTGFEFVTGTVAYALLSLPPAKRPIVIPDNARPGEYHEAYPFTTEGRLLSWRAENGSNWIEDTRGGRIVIIPSGSGLAYTYEDSQGNTGLSGDQQFTTEDITAFETLLNTILTYIQSHKSSQPYTYYLSWSFGKVFDQALLEKWLQMVDKYIDSGRVRWQTMGEMYDDYVRWEIAAGRRNP
jgi:hypothetical protein